MKIKHKIVGLFILAVFISVIVFSATFYNLMNKGYLAGITPSEMRNANEEVAYDIEMNNKQEVLEQILNNANKQYPKMRFSFLMDSEKLIGTSLSHIDSFNKLVEHLSGNEKFEEPTWVIASRVEIEATSGYLITEVDKRDFRTITYYFNGPKARGVLGKMLLLGLAMTLCITSMVTYLFSRNMMKRMKKIDKVIDEFELGSLNIRIDEQKQDEIGKLVYSFNGMAEKIEQQVKVQAEYEEKRKQLISNISHDLRTPLASVVGYSELLMDNKSEEADEKRYVEIIHRKAQYMEKLLAQLLEFSRLENGSMKVELARGDIVECVREILIEYIPSMDEQNIELILNLDENPIFIWLDQDKMERVIRNLVDNAFKYGMERKQLSVGVYTKGDEAVIEIEDFGQGMDEDTLIHIFDRFYRGDKGRGTKVGGMGLGLSIAQEIIKQHKGKIEIFSRENQGTKVVIKLPMG